MKDKLQRLDALRAIACITVFSFHAYIIEVGSWAVNIFIMLSGFLMTYRALDRVETLPTGFRGCAAFAWRKIKRLYPLYFITLLLLILRIVILAPDDPPVEQLIIFAKQFVASALLIQSWLPNTEWAFSFNAVGWYMSTCLLLYFCFPVILRWVSRRKSIRSALLWCLGIYAFLIVFTSAVCHGHMVLLNAEPIASVNFRHWFGYVFPPVRLGDFTVGCLLGFVFCRSDRDKLGVAAASVFEALSLLAMFVSVLIYKRDVIAVQHLFNILFIPAAGAMVYSFALGKGHVSRLLDNGFTRLVADYSAEIFLVHYTVIKYASPFSTFLPIPFVAQQIVFVVFTFSLTLFGVIVYRRISRRIPALSLRG